MIQITLGNGYKIWDVRDDLPDTSSPDRYNYQLRLLGSVKTIVVHHWASVAYPENLTPKECIPPMRVVYDMWRARDEYHNTAGYPYHYTVFPNGETFYNGGVETMRACVAKHNADIVCIALPGNFMQHAPGQKQQDALRHTIANLRYAMGSRLPVVPHRSYGDTDCPGKTWDQWAAYVTGG